MYIILVWKTFYINPFIPPVPHTCYRMSPIKFFLNFGESIMFLHTQKKMWTFLFLLYWDQKRNYKRWWDIQLHADHERAKHIDSTHAIFLDLYRHISIDLRLDDLRARNWKVLCSELKRIRGAGGECFFVAGLWGFIVLVASESFMVMRCSCGRCECLRFVFVCLLCSCAKIFNSVMFDECCSAQKSFDAWLT